MAETIAQKKARIEADLVEIRAAISRALKANMTQKGDRLRRNEFLRDLRRYEKEKERELASLERGGIPVRRVIPV